MLLIKSKIGESEIHGVGLFADEFISKGTEVWRFTPGFDMKFTAEQLLQFPDSLQKYMYTYAWRSKKSKLYCFASDNGKYFNHSENPNVLSEYRDGEEEVVTVAIRDIQKGEEIVDDYRSFFDDASDDNVLDKIADKFNLQKDLDSF